MSSTQQLLAGDPARRRAAADRSSWWPICPYNIASPLVIELLLAGVELLAFTVQKEVAERLRAAAGSDDYGPLSVMVQLLARRGGAADAAAAGVLAGPARSSRPWCG